ncbi:glycoside hydrolase family 10 protein [Candidatus Latescibacterota bacterium]
MDTVSAEPEVRGLWVVRDTITSPEKVKNLVEFAAIHRYNVLFVQVRGRGDAFYRSYFVPGPEDYPHIPGTFDPLAEVIKLAHAQSIEVHAWFNMYYTWSAETMPVHPEHLLNTHPEWFMVSLEGQNMAREPIGAIFSDTVEGRYLSPGLETVRDYLSRVITEVLVTYNIDGIHLDYVRYPGREYDFHPKVCWDFKGRYGVDPQKVVAGDDMVDPTLEYLGKWVEHRVEQIDKQVRSIKRRINLVDKNIRLSAAVKPHADEAYFQYGQNWVGWLNEGIMDFVVTMSYFPDTAVFSEMMNGSLKQVDKRKVIGGVGGHKQELTPEKAAEQISFIRDIDLLGYCIFSYTIFLEDTSIAKVLNSLAGQAEDRLPFEFKPYIRTYYE